MMLLASCIPDAMFEARAVRLARLQDMMSLLFNGSAICAFSGHKRRVQREACILDLA